PRLLLERSLSTVLGIPARETCPGPAEQVDEFGHALPIGALQEIRPHGALAFGRHLALDEITTVQWSGGGDEQQNQVYQPSFFWLSYHKIFRRSYLSLLCQAAATC